MRFTEKEKIRNALLLSDPLMPKILPTSLKKGSLKVGYKDRSEKLQKNQDDIFYERIKNINDLCLMHFCITLSQTPHFCQKNGQNLFITI